MSKEITYNMLPKLQQEVWRKLRVIQQPSGDVNVILAVHFEPTGQIAKVRTFTVEQWLSADDKDLFARAILNMVCTEVYHTALVLGRDIDEVVK
ncbi:hypothetical protein D3C74_226850 [compost metagenome]